MNKSEKNEYAELREKMIQTQQLMKQYYSKDQCLTSQRMLQLSQSMDRYIVAYMKARKSSPY